MILPHLCGVRISEDLHELLVRTITFYLFFLIISRRCDTFRTDAGIMSHSSQPYLPLSSMNLTSPMDSSCMLPSSDFVISFSSCTLGGPTGMTILPPGASWPTS